MKEELDKINKHLESKENEDLAQAKSLMNAIQEKLDSAAEKREENIQAVVKRVRDHEESVAKAIASQKAQLDALKDRINAQLDKAAKNRDANLQKIVDEAKLRDQQVEAAKLKKSTSNE